MRGVPWLAGQPLKFL